MTHRHYLHQSWRHQAALAALQQGKLIAYPTEAVWGLGCDPWNGDAVEQLLALKHRSVDKGLILVAADYSQLGDLVDGLPIEQRRLLSQQSAQPTTWLIAHRARVPSWISGSHSSVAVRISHHPIVKALCEGFGGMLVSTSANRAGQLPAYNELRARAYFGSRVASYVAGSTSGMRNPSKIIDLASGQRLR